MKFALLGTGFISESYLKTLELHPGLTCVGVHDRDAERSRRVGEAFGLKVFPSLSSMLEGGSVELVVNLTNPREHLETTRSCLQAGKHVYSEKPLAMKPFEAKELVELAASVKRRLGTAPCSVLSPCAQLLWRSIREGRIGNVRMVYANFDDGMIAPHAAPWGWANGLGIPWPAKDEFEVGCTYEHAGYFLTWLCSFFGPVESMSAFASTQINDKGIAVDKMAPDFTCGLLRFRDGIVARATCGLVAPKDKSLTIAGDKGTLHVENLRDDYGTVWFEPYDLSPGKVRVQSAFRRFQRLLPSVFPDRLRTPLNLGRRQPLNVSGPRPKLPIGGEKRVDFLRGPAELAEAIRNDQPSRLPGELGLHIVEIIYNLQYPQQGDYRLQSSLPELIPFYST